MLKSLDPRGYLKVNNLFSQSEVVTLKKLVSQPHWQKVQEIYGRMRYFGPFKPIDVELDFEIKLTEKINNLLKTDFPPCQITMCTTYSLEYGEPELPPHFDGDSTDLILNYQLESNTDWPVGVDQEIVKLEDNSAIMFNPNVKIHWRPRKLFNKDEYVTMIFFRFQGLEPVDNTHLRLLMDDPIFDEARSFRDSL
jgi:hypothetical protein